MSLLLAAPLGPARASWPTRSRIRLWCATSPATMSVSAPEAPIATYGPAHDSNEQGRGVDEAGARRAGPDLGGNGRTSKPVWAGHSRGQRIKRLQARHAEFAARSAIAYSVSTGPSSRSGRPRRCTRPLSRGSWPGWPCGTGPAPCRSGDRPAEGEEVKSPVGADGKHVAHLAPSCRTWAARRDRRSPSASGAGHAGGCSSDEVTASPGIRTCVVSMTSQSSSATERTGTPQRTARRLVYGKYPRGGRHVSAFQRTGECP